MALKASIQNITQDANNILVKVLYNDTAVTPNISFTNEFTFDSSVTKNQAISEIRNYGSNFKKSQTAISNMIDQVGVDISIP